MSPTDRAPHLIAPYFSLLKPTSTAELFEFARTHSAATTNTVFDAADNVRQKISDTAGKAQDRVARASTDLETTIEHQPMVAALVAMVAGMLVGLLSHGRK